MERARAPSVEVVRGHDAARTRSAPRARARPASQRRARRARVRGRATRRWASPPRRDRPARRSRPRPRRGPARRRGAGTAGAGAGAGGGRAARRPCRARLPVRSRQSFATSQQPTAPIASAGTVPRGPEHAHDGRAHASTTTPRCHSWIRRPKTYARKPSRWRSILSIPGSAAHTTSPTRCRSHSRQAICPTLEPSHGTPRASSVTSRTADRKTTAQRYPVTL